MRNQIDHYFSGAGTETPPLVVLAERLSARIGGMALEAMQNDAAHWVGNQAKLRQLLSLDGVVIGADPSLAAEACGQTVTWRDDQAILAADPVAQVSSSIAESGRQVEAIEALTRLCQTERAATGCIAMMTGPATLAWQLFGTSADHLNDVKPLAVALVEQFCQARPDLLLLREGAALGQGDIGMPQRKAFNTLKNMAAYFDVPVGLYLENYQPDILPQLEKLKLPFLWLGGDVEGASPAPDAVQQFADDYQGVGVPIDFSVPETVRRQAADYAATLGGSNYLLTSLGELERDLDLDALIIQTRELHD